MAKRNTTKKTDIGGRELVLAGIGAVSLTRKQAIRAYDALVAEGAQTRDRIESGMTELRGQIEARAKQVRADVTGRIKPVFTQINDRVEPIITTISSRAESAKNDLQTRLQPLLAKVGIETKKKPAPRKRKPAAKRTVRKAAPRKRVAKKAA